VTLSDERLRQLAAETLELARSGRDDGGAIGGSSDDRIAALEARVRRLEAALAVVAPIAPALAMAPVPRLALPMVHAHPHDHGAAGHQYGLPPAMGERCVLEPGSPCVGHGTCKSHGY
jgi:hypothetical protein